jgi:Cu+-exporting ATPase
MIREPENPELYFCCNGCQGVYHLLKSDGLDSFYEKIGNNKLSPPVVTNSDTSSFDMESFKKRYIKTTKDGFSSIDLIIEGIHCSACVWLNEKVLSKLDGVVEANINFTNNKAKVIWDDEVVSLSKIIDTIRNIGYNAYPYERSSEDIKATKSRRDYFLKMAVAIFSSMNIMMIDIAKYAGFFSGIKPETLKLIHIAEFIFATPVLFYSGWIFFRGAYYGLKNRIVNMDFLVISGATLTYIYSLLVLFGLVNGHSYFDSVAMIITFVLVGKYLEVLGKKSAVDTMDKIRSKMPLEVTIVKDNSKVVIPIDSVKVGDILEVKNGERVGVDGVLLSQEGLFDESSLSGESIPIEKKKGDRVYSGTINVGQVVRVEATTDYANSTISNIVNLLEDALNSKPQIENRANELSKYFSITILSLALLTFIGWFLFTSDFERSLIVAISVIVIACPCALALATPIASLVGISFASEKGILFKEAKFIETLSKADTIIFDKTGTLTEGKLRVINAPQIDKEYLDILYTLSSSSNHPVSLAIKRYLEDNYSNLKLIELENINQVSGMGLEAKYAHNKVFGGSSKLLKLKGIDVDNSDYTEYFFVVNREVIASFKLEDTLRDGAKDLISYLKSINLNIILATGDNLKVAKRVADILDIDDVRAGLSPFDKANLVDSLKSNESVVMVGDGINDSLALSKADISIVMGSGADIALSVSDIVILNNSLKSIKYSFFISKRTFKFIKQNLAISLIYNSITIPIAIAGHVIPLVAALSMSFSSLLVVGNSMRIKLKEID